MGECLKTIDEYYTNLIYGYKKCRQDKEVSIKIYMYTNVF